MTGEDNTDGVRGLDVLVGVPILWAFEWFLGILLIIYIFCADGLGESPDLARHPLAILVATFCSAGAALGVTTWLVCRKYGRSFRDGFRLTRVSRKTALLSVLLGVGYAVPAILLFSRFSTGEGLFAEMAQTPVGVICLLILTVAIPPFEELYYHGFLFPALQRSWGSVAAVAVVTCWFAGAHIVQLFRDPIGIPIIAVAVGLWTVQRCVTKSLTPPLISHLTYNLCITLGSLAAIVGLFEAQFPS